MVRTGDWLVGVGGGEEQILTNVVAAKTSQKAARATRATTRMMVPLMARRRS